MFLFFDERSRRLDLRLGGGLAKKSAFVYGPRASPGVLFMVCYYLSRRVCDY